MILQLDLAFARAEVDRLAGRPDAERAALEGAIPIAEQKRNLVALERIRAALAEIP